LVGLLPRQFFAHLSPGLTTILQQTGTVTSHGPHYKMALVHPSRLDSVDTSGVERLSEADAPALCPFFAQNYPRNWFDPRMLSTGQYFGLRGPNGFLSVAGVHVYSERYRVAALGNVTTHTAHRGSGLATKVVAALCQNLRRTVDHVGLNVAAGNAAAIRCYQRLGFEIAAEYEECDMTLS
jgi:ribosomal protein S18 acetylase RimI-like enzyme